MSWLPLFKGVFKPIVVDGDGTCISNDDIEDCLAKDILKESMTIGKEIHSGLPSHPAIMFGMCKMIGDLQEEVSALKQRLENNCEKSI